MRLLHKVVKSSRVITSEDKISIDNTVCIPIDVILNQTDTELTAEQLFEKRIEAETEKIRREAERKTAEGIEAARREIMAGAAKERDIILSTAKYEAAKLNDEARAALKKAELDSVAIKEAAERTGYSEGYASGMSEGKSDALSRCEKYVDAAAELLSDINARKEAYYISHEEEMKDCVMEMVRRITLSELKTDKDVILGIIRQAAKPFKNSDYLKISLSDGEIQREIVSDAELVSACVSGIKHIELEILPSAEDGTIILDNDSEILDASVPTQLDFLKEILNSSKGRTS